MLRVLSIHSKTEHKAYICWLQEYTFLKETRSKCHRALDTRKKLLGKLQNPLTTQSRNYASLELIADHQIRSGLSFLILAETKCLAIHVTRRGWNPYKNSQFISSILVAIWFISQARSHQLVVPAKGPWQSRRIRRVWAIVSSCQDMNTGWDGAGRSWLSISMPAYGAWTGHLVQRVQ